MNRTHLAQCVEDAVAASVQVENASDAWPDLLRESSLALAIVDAGGGLVSANRAFFDLCGDRAAIPGTGLLELLEGRFNGAVTRLEAPFANAEAAVIDMPADAAHTQWCLVLGDRCADRRLVMIVPRGRRAGPVVRRDAETDSLTGLGNQQMPQRCIQDWSPTAPQCTGLAAIMIAIERFEEIKGTIGDVAGDALM